MIKITKLNYVLSLCLLIGSALLTVFPNISAAQTISIGQQSLENRNINRPKQGMNQSLVLKLFGKPISASSPVGTPPMSRWQYKHFTVYFEGRHVIHSVLNKNLLTGVLTHTKTSRKERFKSSTANN